MHNLTSLEFRMLSFCCEHLLQVDETRMERLSDDELVIPGLGWECLLPQYS